MMKILYFFSCLLISYTSSSQPTTSQALDSFMRAANHAHVFNGNVLVTRHDSILLNKGYGFRNIEQKELHDNASVFQVGSLGKSFTAIAVMQQVEKGKLQLTDKLSKFFPFYTIGKEVTIEELLTHTAGIYECSRDKDYMATIYATHMNEKRFWEIFGNRPLDFMPGTEYKYSNTGYMILGYVLQKITGRSYFDLVRENIFKPVGMLRSGFDFAGNHDPKKSTGYEKIYIDNVYPARIVDSSHSFSAGSVYSTTEDLNRYQLALRDGKLLSPSSMEKMFTPHKNNYGFGWIIEDPMNKKVITHEGGLDGFLSLEAFIPEDKISIILLLNHRDDYVSPRRLYFGLFQILYNQPYLLPRLAMKLPDGAFEEYTGDYELADNLSFKGHLSTLDGHLLVQWNQDKPIELFTEKKDFLFTTVYDMQLDFRRDEKGTVTGFTAYTQGGKSFVYNRIAKK